MAIIDNRTAGRGYALPSAPNKLKDDVPRIVSALTAVDTDVTALLLALAGKAALAHGHAIADTTGLQTALDGKIAVGYHDSLDDLADVNVNGAASGQVLIRQGAAWIPVALQVGNITNLETLLDAKADGAATTTALGLKAPLASPPLTGTPTAPTAAAGTDTTQIATTGFVAAGLASKLSNQDTTDPTKKLALNLSGISGSTTVTLTFPDASGTIQYRVAATTDNTLVRFDGAGGAQQASGIVVDDLNNVSGIGTLLAGSITGTAAATITRQINIRSSSNTTGPADLRFLGANDTILGYVGISGAGSEIEVWNHQAGAINFGTNNTLRAWITSAGAFVIGAAASPTGAVNGKTFAPDAMESSRSTVAAATHQFYYNPNGTVGTISTSGSATAYNTSSDEDLKVFDGQYGFEDAVDIIRADPVRRFRWKADGSAALGWGAQTSYSVSPELATPGQGTPGEENYQPWGMDHSKRAPYLWAAVAGLLDLVDALELRLQRIELGSDA